MRGIARSAMASYVQPPNGAAPGAMREDLPRSPLRRFARQQPARAVQAEAFIWRASSYDVLEQRLADESRDVWLQDQGFQVLRAPNELVIGSTELAVARIRNAMTDRAGLREAVALSATPLIRRCFATTPSPARGEGGASQRQRLWRLRKSCSVRAVASGYWSMKKWPLGSDASSTLRQRLRHSFGMSKSFAITPEAP